MLLTLNEKQGRREPVGRLREVSFCANKQELINDFLEAVHELAVLQQQQAQAVIEDDPDFSRFDLLLHFAQEKKDTAKYAWIAHVERHGC
jgi:hypothetical protein